jgi:hypothetical protein
MVFYQQQHLVLLAQISEQISSIAPQVSIPSTPLPSYNFSPNASDVRVNAFWFMSLIFSLSAALLATLVQQWVRDYMHVFQRYSNPLKCARLRQYLYEGVEGWYMPRVATSVPGLLHVSLFLFFVGLGDFLLSVYTPVGVATISLITICGLLYIFSMFAPVINPQSPFRNPFSGLIWYLKQKVHPRHYLDRASGGTLKAVSPNMSEGQMQLAMEEGDGRKDRDVRAIQWLIHNRTEDDEMESFAMAIPGTFNSKWGIDVWKKASEANSRPDNPTVGPQSDADLSISIPPHHYSPHFQRTSHLRGLLRSLGRIFGIRIANGTPHDVMATRLMPRLSSYSQALADPPDHGDLVIYDLCERLRHLAGTCDNYSIFTNKELWLKRARGCIETAASLVFCADIEPELFGDLERLLIPLHEATSGIQTAPGSDGLFVARLDCLSFVILNRGMENHDGIKLNARAAINALSRFGMEDDGGQSSDSDDDEDKNALKNARIMDDYFKSAKQFCLSELRELFRPSGVETTEEQVREALARDHEADISMLERITLAVTADQEANIDTAISKVNDSIIDFSDELVGWLRGADFDVLAETGLAQPIKFFNPVAERAFFYPQFIYLHQRLRLLCSYSSKLRDIINGQGDGAYQEMVESLGTLWSESDNHDCSGVHQQHLMERQLYRLQDWRDGGGFGFWVELSFPVVHQILKIPLSSDAHFSLIIGLFKTITYNWRQHKHSIGTQRVILNIICDMAIYDRGPLSDLIFPSYLIDELLVLVDNMMDGQSGSHIDASLKELDDATKEQDVDPVGGKSGKMNLFRVRFRVRAVKAISRSRAPASSVIE